MSEYLERCPVCNTTCHKRNDGRERKFCSSCKGKKPDPIDSHYLRRGGQSSSTGVGYLD